MQNFKLGCGRIILDAWGNMKLLKIIKKWSPHSPYEITAIYYKRVDVETKYPSWFNESAVVAAGFVRSIKYTCNRFQIMIKNLFIKTNYN